MRLQEIEVTAAGLLAGLVMAAIGAGWRRARRRAADWRQATERQMEALAAAVRVVEEDVTELRREARLAQRIDAIGAGAEEAGAAQSGKSNRETLAVIAAAATAFLGKGARIRSAHLAAPAAETVGPWSQQGRMMVQTSHNLRVRE